MNWTKFFEDFAPDPGDGHYYPGNRRESIGIERIILLVVFSCLFPPLLLLTIPLIIYIGFRSQKGVK